MAKKLGEVLVESGVISEAELRLALRQANGEGTRLGQTLIELGLADERNVMRALAKQANLDFIDVESFPIQKDALERVGLKLCRMLVAVPLMIVNRELLVAMVAPADPKTIHRLSVASGVNVRPVIATVAAIKQVLSRLEAPATVAVADGINIVIDF